MGILLAAVFMAGCPDKPRSKTVTWSDAVSAVDGGGPDPVELRGRPAVLVFQAAWCPPCQPLLEELSTSGGNWPDSTFLVWAIDVEGEAAGAGSTWAGVRRAVLRDSELLSAFRIDVLPTALVLDRSGSIAARFEGYSVGMGAEVRGAAAEAWAE